MQLVNDLEARVDISREKTIDSGINQAIEVIIGYLAIIHSRVRGVLCYPGFQRLPFLSYVVMPLGLFSSVDGI